MHSREQGPLRVRVRLAPTSRCGLDSVRLPSSHLEIFAVLSSLFNTGLLGYCLGTGEEKLLKLLTGSTGLGKLLVIVKFWASLCKSPLVQLILKTNQECWTYFCHARTSKLHLPAR